MVYAFILGRDKQPYIAQFHTASILTFVFIRWVEYKTRGSHYFLLDWCYFSNYTIIYYMLFEPKNVYLFRTAFLYALGCLGMAIVTFRNSLVFHKIDYITSLSLHACPMLNMSNIRYHLMVIEQDLPEQERNFVHLDEVYKIDNYFEDLILYPLKFYICWALIYYFINFILKEKKIREN
jgi:hypothetical protein